MLTALMAGKVDRERTGAEMALPFKPPVPPAKTGTSDCCTLRQGRHKYFSLANEEVAGWRRYGLAANVGPQNPPGPKDKAPRSRVCYNHLAGNMGTRLFDNLVSRGFRASQMTKSTSPPERSSFRLALIWDS